MFSEVRARNSWLVSVVGIGIVLSLSVSSCSDERSQHKSDELGNAEWSIVEPTAFGDVSINARPEKVIASWFDLADISRALGTDPIAVGTYGESGKDTKEIYPWLKGDFDKISDSQIFGEAEKLNLEKIAKYNPDLIIATPSSLDDEIWKKSSSIAPVYSGPANDQEYEDKVISISRMLTGSEEKGREVLSQTESEIEEFVSSNPELKEKKYIYGGCSASDNKWAFGDGQVLEDFGLVPSVNQGELSYETISPENLTFSDADVVIARCTEDQQKALVASPNIGDAIRSGSVAVIWTDPKESRYTSVQLAFTKPSPSSYPWLIDNFGQELVDAIGKPEL